MQRMWTTNVCDSSWFSLFSSLLKQKQGGEGREGAREEEKRDDLWALGEGEPHEYPSLSGGEREKRGLDGGVRGAEGEGANGAPNHILHLRVILGLYICIYICICMCLHSKCGAVRVSQVCIWYCTVAVWAKIVAVWGLYVENTL